MSILTETQCRTARALLEWSQADLAKKSNLSESTIRDFEKRRRTPSANNLAAIVAAFRNAGVVLINDGDTMGVGGEGARFAEDASGKKLENELVSLERELHSALALRNFLAEQRPKSEEMQNNIGYERLLSQAEHEVRHLEIRVDYTRARLASDNAAANRAAEAYQRFEEERESKGTEKS